MTPRLDLRVLKTQFQVEIPLHKLSGVCAS
jgi:hypothetical protein